MCAYISYNNNIHIGQCFPIIHWALVDKTANSAYILQIKIYGRCALIKKLDQPPPTDNYIHDY